MPKLPLLLRPDHKQLIAHTQPRRIAAREIASRVASEMGVRLGDVVGYKVRFGERIGPKTRIKVLTDGMLLSELDHDRRLSRYHTIIIDEAHERSLNIDFLLGYLKRLLKKREDLKLLITSATIDTERFSEHFDKAPVVQVSGRTFPVETVYLSTPKDQEAGSSAHILAAVKQAWSRGVGDILIFLAGEREIRETREFLSRRLDDSAEILTLYARLAPAEQKKIFFQSNGQRIILSTNVAETSLTVPGVKYVIDVGSARISRYSAARKIQRLPIEKISQASANQRKGRCGRVQSGVCFRLYSQDDFDSRAEFSDPEVVRTSLASVILKMKILNLGEVQSFPFLDRPDHRQVKSGLRLLGELSALDEELKLTSTGRELARLPVDPRVGRLLIEGRKLDCLAEMLIIGSRLSVPDVEIVPKEKSEVARQHHKTFPRSASDIQAILDLWAIYHEQKESGSRRALERWCESNFLSSHRMYEWLALHQQLRLAMKEKVESSPALELNIEGVAKSLITGFISNVCKVEEKGEYLGTQNKKLIIHPSSRFFKSGPKWLVATAVVDSGRPYARQCLGIRPEWIESVAANQMRYELTEPWWDSHSGNVLAFQSGSLQGLRIFSRRKKNYSQFDPVAAREIFIQQALVEMGASKLAFAEANLKLRAVMEQIRHKTRGYEIWVDEEGLQDYFNKQLPDRVFSIATLKKWLRANPAQESALFLTAELLLGNELNPEDSTAYPDRLAVGGNEVPVNYQYQPGKEFDGATIQLPLALLGQFEADVAERQMGSWFEQRIEGLIRCLPKSLRRPLVPIADKVERIVSEMRQTEGDIVTALTKLLNQNYAIKVSTGDFDLNRLDNHLRLRLEVVSEQGALVDSGRNIKELKQTHGSQARDEFEHLGASDYRRQGFRRWDFEDLQPAISLDASGQTITAFPGLVDLRDNVGLELFDNSMTALQSHRAGLRRLALCYLGRQVKDVVKSCNLNQLALRYAGLFPGAEFTEMFRHEIIARSIGFKSEEVWTKTEFLQALTKADVNLVEVAHKLATDTSRLLEVAYSIRDETSTRLRQNSYSEAEKHIDQLIAPDNLFLTPEQWFAHLPRFLKSILLRLEKSAKDPDRDQQLESRIASYSSKLAGLGVKEIEMDNNRSTLRWMLEEFHVSLFAQQLGTSIPISAKRLDRQLQKIAQAVHGI
ncbi:MAG: ATP-dependent helicase HrpA [Parasphingorhabdus sp.]